MTDKELRSGEDSMVQKQAGKAVRERQTRFRRISAITSDIAYSCHTRKDGGFSLDWITRAADRITGYSIEEIKAHGSFRFLVIEEDIPLFEKNVIGLAPGSRGSCELRIRHKNGNTVWISSFAECVAAAKIPGRLLYGGLTEITERKQAEDKLQVAQLQWSQFLEVSPDPMWIKDASGRYVAASKSYFHADPSAEGNIIGKTDAECFPPEKAAVYVANDRVAIERGATEGEFTAVGVDGKLRNFLTKKVVLRAPDGSVAGTLGVSRDITDRKKIEEALQDSVDRWRVAIDAISDIVCLISSEHTFLAINEAGVRALNLPRSEIIGRKCYELVHGTTCPIPVCPCSKAIETGLEGSSDYEQGGRFYSLQAWPLKDKSGHVTSLVHIVKDITERKRAEADKEAMQAQLRQSQKMGAIGQLAGGIAHDFNNLLTGILGNIALMRSSLAPADPLLENLNAAETSARQAADLTKGLLTFSRSAMILPVPMNIAAALDVTLTLLKQSLPATMEIVRDHEQTAWNVLLDQSQLTQILLNLAVNARDAMKGKGTLTIRARDETVDAAYVHEHPYARTGEFVHLSVSDTGSGMSAEVMQHLFEPFYTTKPVGSGTGLGLSIVYGAVKQAGGWITAVSMEGVGVTFDIYLPRCLEESIQSVTPSPLPVNAGSGTILVVEDEPIVCAVAQALLSRSGYTVLTAPDGTSALNILREHPVSIGLILLDMTMPGMTTSEVVQAIRALDPKVPILLTSGYTSNDIVRQMLEEGAVQEFLPKPYELHELLEKVQELLHKS
ncbi:PAS domain-containing protein [Candidatus Cryosericum odellii]|jgi:PAS domain S-box-containing protein|uniref:histidine kinase n=2 Tax=Candidatus Cryosericum odellii TaxID=2290917 RepID=A0A398DBS5_9BACT|nr:PAS domain-containing protein [Candidatus Cryosericum odellii]RIE09807.1 PAS domain S-box protein [Candidatus Cryosericum odellii]